MTELEQKKLTELEQAKQKALIEMFVLDEWQVPINYHIQKVQKIIELLRKFDEPKPEPLEMRIVSGVYYKKDITKYVYNIDLPPEIKNKEFDTRQEAIDFCKRHGLKIKE